MRGRPKKRKSAGRVYEIVPNLKQRRIGPSPHRTIRDRHPTWSAPNMRQQSITQMDALRDHYHPELENEYLKMDDEEEDSYVASPTSNKRRKITPEKPQARRSETRSSKRQADKKELGTQKEEDQHVFLSAEEAAKTYLSRAEMPTAMLSPRTPISLRRREIPSSQSPADTPLSTRSRHSQQDYTRSPLKEKSANIDLSTKSPLKGVRWVKKLEVADSMDTEDEDSPVSVRADLTTEPINPTAEPEDLTEDVSQKPSNAFAIHVDDFNQRLKAAQRPVLEIQNPTQAKPRHEVISCTDEEDDHEELEAFNAGPETQAALASTDISQNSSDQLPESTPPTSKSTDDEPELAPMQKSASRSLGPPNAPSLPTQKGETEDHCPMNRSKRVEFVDLVSSDPPRPTTPPNHIERPSNFDEISAQLLADLRRETQPCGLQTESQFEKGWICYTPADDMHPDPEPLPSSPKDIEQPSSSLMTIPTQLIHPPITSPPKFYKAPVPPSQATTVDVTQPSPRNMPMSSQAITERSPRKLPPSSQTYPSSPPPIPPPSSSPLTGRKSDPWERYQWNGVRLTESQLLPASLMDDSLAGPPGWSQESWAEEM